MKAGEPAAVDPAAFTDVPDGQWYSDAVAWASGFNVVEGYGGGVFGPTDPVTREQMAVIFYRWAEGKKYDVGFAANAALLKEENNVTRFVETETPEGYYDSAVVPIGAPVIMMVLSLLFCAIQAVVFTMLTSIYLEEAVETE